MITGNSSSSSVPDTLAAGSSGTQGENWSTCNKTSSAAVWNAEAQSVCENAG